MKFSTFCVLAPIVIVVSIFGSNAASSRIQPKSSAYNQAVNEALDTTLAVGVEFRTAHRSATWKEIQDEVCRRLKVDRKEPWSR